MGSNGALWFFARLPSVRSSSSPLCNARAPGPVVYTRTYIYFCVNPIRLHTVYGVFTGERTNDCEEEEEEEEHCEMREREKRTAVTKK